MKVLFYCQSPRFFKANLIGHFYEISQTYPVVLLSDRLDATTEEIINNRTLFPKLDKIVYVNQFGESKTSLFAKNKHLFELARDTVSKYKPDILILTSDTHSMFELYLARSAKRINTLIITVQAITSIVEDNTMAKFVDLTNTHMRFSSFLPLKFRLFLVECRKTFGHFLYYWILPLTVGEKPFLVKASFIRREGVSGMGNADYHIVLSKKDYQIHRNVYLKHGISPEKLYILPHPLTRETRKFFETAYFNKFRKNKEKENGKKIITMMLPETEIGFKRKDYSLISNKEIEKTWIDTLKTTSQIFPQWKIYVKPHPDIKNFISLKKIIDSVSEKIEVVSPQESAEKYIEVADVIVGLPLSASSILFTASLQCPEKPIISLDFNKELLGDAFKDFNGITYVDDKSDFVDILKAIRDDKYRVKINSEEIKDGDLNRIEFSNALEMLNRLYADYKKANQLSYKPKHIY